MAKKIELRTRQSLLPERLIRKELQTSDYIMEIFIEIDINAAQPQQFEHILGFLLSVGNLVMETKPLNAGL